MMTNTTDYRNCLVIRNFRLAQSKGDFRDGSRKGDFRDGSRPQKHVSHLEWALDSKLGKKTLSRKKPCPSWNEPAQLLVSFSLPHRLLCRTNESMGQILV